MTKIPWEQKMTEKSIPAAIRSLAARAEPLIDWYKKNKPRITWVRVSAADLKMLQRPENEEKARVAGFVYRDGEIYLRGYRLIGSEGTPLQEKDK